MNPKLNTKWDCLNTGGEWLDRDQNFNNFPNAVQTIFMMMTTSGWMYVMYDGIYSTEIDRSPERNYHIYYGYYFILVMIVSSFFI
jgi:hypothetical protein